MVLHYIGGIERIFFCVLSSVEVVFRERQKNSIFAYVNRLYVFFVREILDV